MKELTLDEISLLEEMKSNCLKKGQYIDDKAKDKFKILCHLEDFGIAYYELLDVIKEVREYINKIPTQPVIRVFKKELLEILDKGKE
ncbi:MAG: hypothetical protein IIZ67_07285 [Bacilli bacterium]|nr:hypothetical protein [Bacilli bacterium]